MLQPDFVEMTARYFCNKKAERNTDQHRNLDNMLMAESHKGLNKNEIQEPPAADNKVGSKAADIDKDSHKILDPAVHNFAADMLAGGSNNQERLALALTAYHNLAAYFLAQIQSYRKYIGLLNIQISNMKPR